MTGPVDGWGDESDHVADVIVVGSGVAGMTAAAAASSRRRVGRRPRARGLHRGHHRQVGRGAVDPQQPLPARAGSTDERADALRYLARTAYPTLYNPEHATLGLPADKHALLEAFYDNGSVAIEELLASARARARVARLPRLPAELPEDTTPSGRTAAASPPRRMAARRRPERRAATWSTSCRPPRSAPAPRSCSSTAPPTSSATRTWRSSASRSRSGGAPSCSAPAGASCSPRAGSSTTGA